MIDTNKLQSPCYASNLRKVSRAITKFYDMELAAVGLKLPQFSLMNYIRRLQPVSMEDLSASMRLERTTLVRNLALLEKDGLVDNSPDDESLAHIIRLTPKGNALMKKALPHWERAQEKIALLLCEDDITILERIMTKLQTIA